ncbi:uncharacterized protein LOC131844457 isoform X2 [Achroia grisella]|nr:uncharacterized protein LOC131844457 isoform X2 [Achroia grisella]XP_059049339.1 uncharacterized protein LOC131844457 isoform X2 [Achroia grisella]
MPFERVWDASCPHVWDRWESDGTSWIIQDLPPEDDEEALDILLKHLCTDEVLCALNDLVNDPESIRGASDLWRSSFKKRTTLACYAESGGKRKLVAVNVCSVKEKEDDAKLELEGQKWINVYKVLEYMEEKIDGFEYLGLDKALSALGLVVHRDYRGKKLGAKLLAAREPLCRHLGIKGTVTIFTGVAAQKSAESCGFTTILEMTVKDFADIGMDYPKNDLRLIKYMVKKYD